MFVLQLCIRRWTGCNKPRVFILLKYCLPEGWEVQQKWVETRSSKWLTHTHNFSESTQWGINHLFIHMLYEHIWFPEHLALLPVTDTIAKMCITTLGQSMCQHLHTFTWQVCGGCKLCVFSLLVNIRKRVPKGADGQTLGVPSSSTSVGPCQTLSNAAGVDPPAPLRSAYLIRHSFAGMLAASLKPNTAAIKRGSVWCCL